MSAARTFILRSKFDVARMVAFVRAAWQEAAEQGWPLAIEIHKQHGRRSLAQNRAYWALLGDIAEDAWVDPADGPARLYDAKTWHGFFAGRFIGWNELPGGGRVPISTTTLDVPEFSSYLEKIQAYAATELGVTHE